MTMFEYLVTVFFVLTLAVFAAGCSTDSVPGAAGPRGDKGQDAVAPTVSLIQATPEQCPTGGVNIVVRSTTTTASVVCNGTAGSDGSIGPAGPSGAPGSAGLNATPVTVVYLCNGSTSYPSVFVETALCIGGGLYAVYSIPDAFMTYLPPGAYTSNGIGSSCNLTIGANCKVSH